MALREREGVSMPEDLKPYPLPPSRYDPRAVECFEQCYKASSFVALQEFFDITREALLLRTVPGDDALQPLDEHVTEELKKRWELMSPWERANSFDCLRRHVDAVAKRTFGLLVKAAREADAAAEDAKRQPCEKP
jgi:hypothetical protein